MNVYSQYVGGSTHTCVLRYCTELSSRQTPSCTAASTPKGSPVQQPSHLVLTGSLSGKTGFSIVL